MDGIIEAPSPNQDERTQPISALVIVYTRGGEAPAAVARRRDPAAGVSSHSVVAEAGQPFRLVPEEKRAWHAGRSYWRGMTGLNDYSVGIEIVNPGHEWGYRAFPDAQIDTVIRLVAEIKDRYRVTRGNIVGHSDIA